MKEIRKKNKNEKMEKEWKFIYWTGIICLSIITTVNLIYLIRGNYSISFSSPALIAIVWMNYKAGEKLKALKAIKKYSFGKEETNFFNLKNPDLVIAKYYPTNNSDDKKLYTKKTLLKANQLYKELAKKIKTEVNILKNELSGFEIKVNFADKSTITLLDGRVANSLMFLIKNNEILAYYYDEENLLNQ